MSLIFTIKEDERIEDLRSQIDMALHHGWYNLAEDLSEDVQVFIDAAIRRSRYCLKSFMGARNGDLPAALTEQAI